MNKYIVVVILLIAVIFKTKKSPDNGILKFRNKSFEFFFNFKEAQFHSAV